MSVTKDDLRAIKNLFDDSLEQLTLNVGQFSLETTKRFDDLERKLTGQINSLDIKLSGKIDDLSEKLIDVTEMADTNRVEIAKIKRKIGMA